MSESALESCSFCRKHKDTVQKLIVSDDVAICNECVNLCQDLLDDTPAQVTMCDSAKDPQEIKAFLDQYVISQHQAKMVMSVAVVNHYKRLARQPGDPEIAKANILMMGPTGTGKTLMAQSIARYLDVPFAIADATSITEAGYVGDDVESLISRLHGAAGHDVDRTQRGIIFVDEIDKISRRSESSSITRDVSGEGVQQALLKLIEGTVCRIPSQPGRKHPSGDMIEIDTSEILFIAGGAFVGLDTIISNRLQGTSMGFASDVKSKQTGDFGQVVADDLVKFGMIPEFVGRFPVCVNLEPLTQQDLVEILTEVKHNLQQQYQWLMSRDGIQLTFQPDALQHIAALASQSGTGARSLQGVLERVMMPHMYAVADYRRRGIEHIDITVAHINNPTTL